MITPSIEPMTSRVVRRPGKPYMTPAEFTEAVEVHFGRTYKKTGAKTEFAKYAGLNYSTVLRYSSGRTPVPKPIALIFDLLMARKEDFCWAISQIEALDHLTAKPAK